MTFSCRLASVINYVALWNHLFFFPEVYDAFNIASDNFQTDILLRRMLTDRTRARHKVEKVQFWESQ